MRSEAPSGGERRRGYRCNEETDTCVKVIREPKSCKGVTCAFGERCRLGRCVTKKPPRNPPTGRGAGLGALSSGRIIQVVPVGSKSRLILNRGAAHNVSVGDIVPFPAWVRPRSVRSTLARIIHGTSRETKEA